MGIAAGAASAILRAFAWDVRKLRRAWDDDSIAVFQKAKVDFDMCEGHRVIPATGGMECAVCLDDGMEELILLSGCGHSFCRPCWEGFVASNVKSSEVTGLTCMEMQCKMAVPESLFAQLVQTCSGGDGGLLEKYNRFLAESWVKEQPMVKFCPGMDCDRAIDGRSHISSVTDQTPVKCDCGQVSCWGCSTEQHAVRLVSCAKAVLCCRMPWYRF
jgi:ariadne-1